MVNFDFTFEFVSAFLFLFLFIMFPSQFKNVHMLLCAETSFFLQQVVCIGNEVDYLKLILSFNC